MNATVKAYRTIVFLLALGYSLYLFVATDHSAFGWQFRYLTIWGLTANLIAAGQMLRLSLRRTHHDWNSFLSMTVVLNVVVVVNYWKLFFTDPKALDPDGRGLVWYMEYYLHLLGPLLMIFDAFAIQGVFRNIRRVCVYAVVLGIAYPLWVELLVAPLNDVPAGTITSGLPYPFLNNMQLAQRLMFYGTIMATNFVFIAIGWGITRVLPQRNPVTPTIAVSADA